jgi:outer membrane protein assembly factor BamB
MTIRPILVLFALAVCAPGLRAADWPMWRYDAQRTSASPQQLAEKLYLQWSRDLPPEVPAWPEQEKMPFDLCYEPVIAGKTLYLNSSRHDCIRALDLETGDRRWVFYADGPIRFAPAVWQGKLFFTADDGYLYALDADKGTLLWKRRGGPSDRKILGNERLISTWPARGAPVVADGVVYFAASIWPFMGIFIHAVDANTGEILWTNDGDGSVYMKQPHNVDAFAGVAPQGPLAIHGTRLLVPGGRSVPAAFDRATGKMLTYTLAENGKRGGGSDVAVLGPYHFNGGAVFTSDAGKYQGDFSKQVVLTDGAIYGYVDGAVRVYDPATAKFFPDGYKDPPKKPKEPDVVPKDGEPIAPKQPALAKDDGPKQPAAKGSRWPIDQLAIAATPPAEAFIKAGDRLYVGGEKFVLAIDPDPAKREHGSMPITWQVEVPGTVVRLIAGGDRLIAATREGPIYCFGAEQVQPHVVAAKFPELPVEAIDWRGRAEKILNAGGARAGYAVVFGGGNGALVRELAAQSKLHVVVLEPDAGRVETLRQLYTANDTYGTRIAVLQDEGVPLPPYFASLIVVDDDNARLPSMGPDFYARAFASLRPFGGTLVLSGPERRPDAGLTEWAHATPQAKIVAEPNIVKLVREGPLPDSADWSHEHADASNTRVSKDKLVKAPLGVLWFGGPSHDGILPRHGHGPQPHVVDGHLIIMGVDLVRCLDIYTGRLLWETSLPGVGAFYNNVNHQPGANGAGSNFVTTSDGVYIAYENSCVKLDLDTGKKLATFRLPEVGGVKGPPKWGYINVDGNYLIGGADPILDIKKLPPKVQGTGDDAAPGSTPQSKSLAKVLNVLKNPGDNMSASRFLVVMDRRTGKVLWKAAATYGFRHNGTCTGGGRLYAIDRLSGDQMTRLKKKADDLDDPFRLVCFDLATGKELWTWTTEVFGTWVSYSKQFDTLVEAGRFTRDVLSDEPKGMRAYNARTGEALWYQKSYLGPAMIHGDYVLQDTGACDLLTGKTKMRPDPLTGEPVPWKWTRTYGCNTPAASENLLTFRSGAAGFFDLCNDGGTGNLGGFRSSCTNNLVVAGGIITAPEYTRTCTCSYQNQTSIALIHMPEAELWTFFGTKDVKGPVKRLGIILGGPGDRRADDGTLWLEYPSTGGASPNIDVQLRPGLPGKNPDKDKVEKTSTPYRHHQTAFTGPYEWVVSSGILGLEEITIGVGKTNAPRRFTVRLFFAEPDKIGVGQRKFHVDVQGKRELTDFDIAQAAGGVRRAVVREIAGVVVDGSIRIRLTSASTLPTLLCGVEVVETP